MKKFIKILNLIFGILLLVYFIYNLLLTLEVIHFDYDLTKDIIKKTS